MSGPGTRKSRNLASNPACTIAMRLPDGLDLVLDGEAAPIDDPAILDAVGALIRQAGWPVEVTVVSFTAPFGPSGGGPPPWRLYRFVFHTAIGQGDAGPPVGASRANPSCPGTRQWWAPVIGTVAFVLLVLALIAERVGLAPIASLDHPPVRLAGPGCGAGRDRRDSSVRRRWAHRGAAMSIRRHARVS